MPGRRSPGPRRDPAKAQEKLRQKEDEQRRAEVRDRETQRRLDEDLRVAQAGMSPWQLEQMNQNDRGFLSRWGVNDSRRTVVPSADDRLDKLRSEAEERARAESQRTYELGLQAQREALERSAQINAAGAAQYQETMRLLGRISDDVRNRSVVDRVIIQTDPRDRR